MEAFAAKREKSVFRNLFGQNSDDSSSSSEESDNEHTDSLSQSENITSGFEIITTFESNSGNVTTKILEQKSLGIAHQLWPAAKFMCNYFEENQNLLTNNENINILELGAGVGLCGLFLSEMLLHNFPTRKQKVILTDLLEAVDRLNQNIVLNELSENVSADVLSWGDDAELESVFAQFDSPPLVIAADCVYWECLFQPLFATLKTLTSKGCEVIIAHVKRWKKDAKFFALCRKHGLAVEVLVEVMEMVPAEHTGIPARQITRMYRIKKI